MPVLDGIFNQRVPCADCPFRKEGGVRHPLANVVGYLHHFVTWPGATFPCHKSVPADDDRQRWSPWREGQVLCAGGLILATKLGHRNQIMEAGLAAGLFDPNQFTEAAKATVFDSVADMVQSAAGDADDES